MSAPLSLLAQVSLVVNAALIATGCCSGVAGDGITEAACDVITEAGCAVPTSQNECFQSYIVRNQDCCGQEYAALMNCFAASEWHCDDDVAVTPSCDDPLEDLNLCQDEHPLCPHPPDGRPISCD